MPSERQKIQKSKRNDDNFPAQGTHRDNVRESSNLRRPLCIEKRDRRGANDGGYTPGPTKRMTAGRENHQSIDRCLAPDLYLIASGESRPPPPTDQPALVRCIKCMAGETLGKSKLQTVTAHNGINARPIRVLRTHARCMDRRRTSGVPRNEWGTTPPPTLNATQGLPRVKNHEATDRPIKDDDVAEF